MQGFIDDKLVTETDANDEAHPPRTLSYATASYQTAKHTVIVKVVNMGKEPLEAKINLGGAQNIAPNGTAIVLAGDPKAVNTVDNPTNVAPKEEALTGLSDSFSHTFPAHSLTLIKLQADASK
jgi:alpha-L-arabinofuranosidase